MLPRRRSSNRHLFAWLIALLTFAGLTLAMQAAPVAPSNLRGAVTGSTALTLIWDDNSTDETGFEIAFTMTGGSPGTFTSTGTTSSVGTISVGLNPNANTTYTFKIRAYIGTVANASAYTNTITIRTAPFDAPNSALAVAQPNGTILLTWVDNAYSEAGYLVDARALPSGTFTPYTSVTANYTGVYMGGFAPGASYEFRVRGYQGNPTSPSATTAYSAVASATTPGTIAPPTGLVVTATDETSVHFAFNDNTASNNGYEIEARLAGSGSFSYLGDGGDVGAIDAPNSVLPGTALEFRVRAFFVNSSNQRIYSAYSNIAAATTPFYPPTNLVVTPSTTKPDQISFSWTDNSNAEDSYELEFRKQGTGSFVSRKIVSFNVTGISNLPEFDPGTVYEFRLRARYNTIRSSYFPTSNGVVATTKDGFVSRPYSAIQVGTPFSYQLQTLGQHVRSNLTVGTLPPGLTYNSPAAVIEGTPTTAGIYTVPLTATFSGGGSHAMNLVLRVMRPAAPPQVTAAIGNLTLLKGGSTNIALETKFADPETESAIRMATTLGNIDLILYSNSAPQTVANFLGYVNRGDYNNSIFHRAIAGFIFQGGGYRPYAAPDVFEHLFTQSPVPNEPGIPNTIGTLAMAKIADDPDSATSEFFFNFNDNRSNLDYQNGGFTVFGRVTLPTFNDTLPILANLPTGDYPVQFHIGSGNFSSGFDDLPLDQYPLPSAVDQSKLVKITGITSLPILSFTITANNTPSVAAVTLAGTNLQINGLQPGVTTITISATDVDGNVTTQDIPVQVQQTFAQWITGQGTPGGQSAAADNPDHDGFTNLQEWAFFGVANIADAQTMQPGFSRTQVGAQYFAEITFPVRKFASSLTYAVEASNTLQSGSWTTIWTSADGLAAPVVSAALDQADRTIVTIRDTTANLSQRFLRVRVQ